MDPIIAIPLEHTTAVTYCCKYCGGRNSMWMKVMTVPRRTSACSAIILLLALSAAIALLVTKSDPLLRWVGPMHVAARVSGKATRFNLTSRLTDCFAGLVCRLLSESVKLNYDTSRHALELWIWMEPLKEFALSLWPFRR